MYQATVFITALGDVFSAGVTLMFHESGFSSFHVSDLLRAFFVESVSLQEASEFYLEIFVHFVVEDSSLVTEIEASSFR